MVKTHATRSAALRRRVDRTTSVAGVCAAASFVVVLVAGCGGGPHATLPSAPVTIIVTSGGEPVTEGEVNLSNIRTGQGGGGTLDAEGRATIAAVPLGEYTVTLTPSLGNPLPPEPGQAVEKPRKITDIPPNARNPEKSPLRITVQSGKNEARIDLDQAR